MVDIEPMPLERARHGAHGSVYTPRASQDFKNIVGLFCRQAAHVGPLLGALALDLEFMVQRPATIKESKRSLPCVRPDLDNYIKAVMDALNGVWWKDDGQVCQLSARKAYTGLRRGCIVLKLWRI
jgi:Holliday junction resolvase RusA-like endonuclease